MGLGGRSAGASLGPSALRIAGVVDQVAPHVGSVTDVGDVCEFGAQHSHSRGEGLGYFDSILPRLKAVRSAVATALAQGALPVVLGGDHSLEIGTLPAAVAASTEPLGVLWIDAHADINTPDTSPSGNLHGMVLASATGAGAGDALAPAAKQWEEMQRELTPDGNYLRQENIVWLGLRDVDKGEADRIAALDPRNAITMHEVDRYGLAAMVERAIERLKQLGIKRLWISFDSDVLDPMIAPGTGTRVRGGLMYREAHLLAEMLHEALSDFDLVGVMVAEVNPTLDEQNETATLCCGWLASLFGKRILPPWE